MITIISVFAAKACIVCGGLALYAVLWDIVFESKAAPSAE